MKVLLNNLIVVMAFLVLEVMGFDFVVVVHMVELIAKKIN